ncbi:hypothetical protein AAMO2058_000901800 [Amorphochlora amoebiformis]
MAPTLLLIALGVGTQASYAPQVEHGRSDVDMWKKGTACGNLQCPYENGVCCGGTRCCPEATKCSPKADMCLIEQRHHSRPHIMTEDVPPPVPDYEEWAPNPLPIQTPRASDLGGGPADVLPSNRIPNPQPLGNVSPKDLPKLNLTKFAQNHPNPTAARATPGKVQSHPPQPRLLGVNNGRYVDSFSLDTDDYANSNVVPRSTDNGDTPSRTSKPSTPDKSVSGNSGTERNEGRAGRWEKRVKEVGEAKRNSAAFRQVVSNPQEIKNELSEPIVTSDLSKPCCQHCNYCKGCAPCGRWNPAYSPDAPTAVVEFNAKEGDGGGDSDSSTADDPLVDFEAGGDL